MLNYEYDEKIEDSFNNEMIHISSSELNDQISIRMLALDIFKNWNCHRKSGNEISKEFLFSIEELQDLFYIRVDKQELFHELLAKAHKCFQKKKERSGYHNISYMICGTIYFCVPNLLKIWWIVDQLIPLSIYYQKYTTK